MSDPLANLPPTRRRYEILAYIALLIPAFIFVLTLWAAIVLLAPARP